MNTSSNPSSEQQHNHGRYTFVRPSVVYNYFITVTPQDDETQNIRTGNSAVDNILQFIIARGDNAPSRENFQRDFEEFMRSQQQNNNNNTNQQQSQNAGPQHGRPFHFVFQVGGSPFGGMGPSFEDILNQSFQMHQQRQNQIPTAKKEIDNLPCFDLTQDRQQFLEQHQTFETKGCGVCLEDYNIGDKIIQLPCQHMFHKDCCMPWLEQHNTCPLCRFELALDDKQLEEQRKQRMIERFTREGLEIMDIANRTDKIYDRVNNVRIAIEKIRDEPIKPDESKTTERAITAELNSCELLLNQAIDQLDAMQELKDDKLRQKRKNQVVKIQLLLKMIDDNRVLLSEQNKVREVDRDLPTPMESS